jgi:dipeptidyl-peptidase-4
MKKTFLIFYLFVQTMFAQNTINIDKLNWLPESHSFWVNEQDNIAVYDAKKLTENKIVLTKGQMKASGFQGEIEKLVWNAAKTKVLIYTNSKKVWRANTKGDYWYFDLGTGKGYQLGKGLEASSLMFAKFSNDNMNVAYVSKHNIYLENLESHAIKQLTKDGTAKIINGTFDWVYEEELSCRDGFRWSPDGNSIAFWRVDATDTKYHLMINNTDSLYSYVVPVEYPKAGEKPSSVKIGIINLASETTSWLAIPGEANNNYLPRMEWTGNNEVMVVQLNRHQNEATIYKCNSNTSKASVIYQEKSKAWIL